MLSISKELEKFTAEHSQFELSRNYISLSNCIASEAELISQYLDGFKANHGDLLRCYKGYQMEADLIDRLIKSPLSEHVVIKPEITAFGGLVKGHPDFNYYEFPADFKSVNLEEHFPEYKLPRKVYWQLQGYMLYSKTEKAVAVYEARATGRIIEFWCKANKSIQDEIHEKLTNVVNKIKSL